MKISNSKKELARIISENDGWIAGGFAAQQDDGEIWFSATKPIWKNRCGTFDMGYEGHFTIGHLIANRHQTILSRDDYFHLYPAPDADGWIEWKGWKCPVGEGDRIDVKFSDGDEFFDVSSDCGWGVDAGGCNIIAYRLHKPEQSKPEFCESVTRAIPEPDEQVWTNPPTIEQLAADYRSAKDFAERKQQEADAAKADADEMLRVLEIAGEALGLLVSPITERQEPELVITDWRDLQLNDIIEYVDGSIEDKIGMTGPVVEFAPDATDGMMVRMKCDNGPRKGRLGWPMKWRFIRRP